ncbi:hypothetical protein [Variovorax sp.]|uniref:hypothetical protein n=1 Tax=Variovorax sp. TaxID=1871043 RepID=UPI003BA9BE0E
MNLLDANSAPSRATDIIALQMAAQHLIECARRSGLVVTISLSPRTPPAMGSYDMVFDVREGRHGAA